MNTKNQHKKPTQLHQEKLGMEIPEGFFKDSKKEILDKITTKEKPVKKLFGLRPSIAYPIAASFIVLIGLMAWQFYFNPSVNNEFTQTEEQFDPDLTSDEVLLSALFLDEDGFDRFADDYLFNEVILKAEQEEQQLEDVFINSILVEDSLIDNYMDESILDEIIF